MAQEKLSSEYWGLHRNSLLGSSALFLTALITDSSEFKVFELKFGKLGAGAVSFLLLIASTYCLVALYLEWKEGARQIYREKISQFANQEAVVISEVGQLASITASLNNQMQELERAKSHVQGPLTSFDDAGVADSIDKFKKASVQRLSEDIYATRYRTTESINYEAWIKKMAERYEGEVSRTADELLADLASRAEANRNGVCKSIDNAAVQFGVFAEKIADFGSYQHQTIIKLRFEKFQDWLRLICFGFYLPAFAYVFGLIHCLGRLGLSIGPSFALALLSKLH